MQRDEWDELPSYWPSNHTCPQEEPVPHMGKVTMARDERYKLVLRLYEDDSFIDLENDPDEMHNLINDPAYQPHIQRLKDNFMRWQWDTDSTVPFTRDAR